VQRLGLEPGTFRLQTVGSTAAPGPPFLDMMAQIRRNVIYSVYQFKPVVKNQDEEKPQNKGSKKKVDKGSNKLGAAQAAS